jgi:hypothetical protein
VPTQQHPTEFLPTHAARELVAGRHVHTHALVVSLRDFIRQALDLQPIPTGLEIPMQGPGRTGGGGGGSGERERGKAKDGGGGGGGSAMGLGMGGMAGLGFGQGTEVPTDENEPRRVNDQH